MPGLMLLIFRRVSLIPVRSQESNEGGKKSRAALHRSQERKVSRPATLLIDVWRVSSAGLRLGWPNSGVDILHRIARTCYE